VRWVAWLPLAVAVAGLAVAAVLNPALRASGYAGQVGSDLDTVLYGLAAISATTVGGVVGVRHPRNPVGWLLQALGFWFTWGYAFYLIVLAAGGPPEAGTTSKDLSVYAMGTLLGLVLLLTPTGAPPSPRWRWWVRTAAAGSLIGAASSVLATLAPGLADDLAPGRVIGYAVAGLAVPVGLASLVARFRRATGAERQQVRWLAVAAVPLALAMLANLVGVLVGGEASLDWGPGLCLALLPLAIGAAVLRYRLYDLDRIVSRTVAYGVLTVLLGGSYAVVVLGLGQSLGRSSSVVVAAATLAVAALFQPLRRRVQRVVDRRFDRRRLDAAGTVAGFSTRLRDEIDLDSLTGELLVVVEETMQPASASLWLRPSASSSSSTRSTSGDGRHLVVVP
jgi:hypothetical protein